jgi:1,4-dihydroxy-2-naphthoate octaprenyltransferase
MSNIKHWVSAMRLRTLPLSVSGILVGSAIALDSNSWNNWIFGLALSTTVLFQIISNMANDLGDTLKGTDNDDRLGPERTLQAGVITKKAMKIAIVIFSVLSLISSGALIYVSIDGMSQTLLLTYIGLAIFCVLAAITYTIGKKAYGYHGLGDLMVLIFFGLVSVLGVYSLYTKTFLIDNLLPAVSIGLLSTAVLNLNNMRDYANDAKSGKNTLVVKMGPNQAKLYHALLIVMALLSMAVFIGRIGEPLLFISLVPGIALVFHLRKVMKTTDPRSFDPELKIVAFSTFGISLLFLLIIVYLRTNGL